MDRIYRHQRHIYDLTRKYYLLGRDALIRDLAPLPGNNVLEIGCGTGRNLIVAARRYPDARFFGADVSPAMLATAQASIERAGLANRIWLAEGDATCLNPVKLFGIGQFDRIYFSYTLSMIPDWRRALDNASQMIGPAGRMHVVDFGQQEGLPSPFRSFLFAWLAKFDVTPRAELHPALNEIAKLQGLAMSWTPKLRGYAWAAALASSSTR